MQTLDQIVNKTKYEKEKNISSATSQQISGKTLRVNKIAMKSYLKIESILSCRSRHSWVKLTRTTWVVWKARLYSWLRICNYQFFLILFIYLYFLYFFYFFCLGQEVGIFERHFCSNKRVQDSPSLVPTEKLGCNPVQGFVISNYVCIYEYLCMYEYVCIFFFCFEPEVGIFGRHFCSNKRVQDAPSMVPTY